LIAKFEFLTLENMGLDTNFIKIGPPKQKLLAKNTLLSSATTKNGVICQRGITRKSTLQFAN